MCIQQVHLLHGSAEVPVLLVVALVLTSGCFDHGHVGGCANQNKAFLVPLADLEGPAA